MVASVVAAVVGGVAAAASTTATVATTESAKADARQASANAQALSNADAAARNNEEIAGMFFAEINTDDEMLASLPDVFSLTDSLQAIT